MPQRVYIIELTLCDFSLALANRFYIPTSPGRSSGSIARSALVPARHASTILRTDVT